MNEKTSKGRLGVRQTMIAVLFLLPGVVATLFFRYYTIVQAIKLSFYKYDVRNPPGEFVGLRNFERIFQDSDYWQSWSNTLVLLVLSLLITFFIPIIQALFLEPLTKFQNVATTLYILPAVIPGTINIVLWKWIFHPAYGIANMLMQALGLPTQAWMSDTSLVKFCIVFPGVVGGGLGVLLYLAAIYGISEDVKEASTLDGCTGFKRMWYITLPNIKFLVFIQFVMATIGAMQMLDNIFQYTDGGPGGHSQSAALYIYHQYMKNYNYGQGSAASLILMVVIAILTLFQMRMNERNPD
jgi:multiple sugar transport system permease protein